MAGIMWMGSRPCSISCARPRSHRPLLISCQASPASPQQTLTTTERIFRELGERAGGQQALGAGGGTTYADLQRLDAAWTDLRNREVYGLPPNFVRLTYDPYPPTLKRYDVVVAGGTLGIFLAAALQTAGLRVAVVERGPLQGRAQEWNVSRKELLELVQLGVLTQHDVEEVIAVEFNPVRVGFHGSADVWTTDVLNLGVSPAKLVAAARRRFEAAGGKVLDRHGLQQVWLHRQGVHLRMQDGSGAEAAVGCTLLVDAMGNQSPIVRQVRHGRKPDGVCLVVGTCARGFASNTTGDVIYTAAPSEPPAGSAPGGSTQLANLQLFWEAFPAGSGPTDRTTYMFTYLDASPSRPSLEAMLEHYWQAMPQYQGVTLDELQVQRILFGMFPTYRDSPLVPVFDRVLAVGDASGMQSPLSFGGFAALTRHLSRLTAAITDAVQADAVDKRSLKFINAYNPSLSGAWMMQRAMSLPADATAYNRDFINRLLGGNFAAMAAAGDATLKPFLQDVIQAGPLARTLLSQMASDPLFVVQILGRVGMGPLSDWMVHFVGLVGYTAVFKLAQRAEFVQRSEELPPKQRFIARRAVERWQYGAGLDFEL